MHNFLEISIGIQRSKIQISSIEKNIWKIFIRKFSEEAGLGHGASEVGCRRERIDDENAGQASLTSRTNSYEKNSYICNVILLGNLEKLFPMQLLLVLRLTNIYMVNFFLCNFFICKFFLY